MKKNELENRIYDAFANSTPEVFDSITANLGESGSNIIDIKMRRRRSPVKAVAAIAAVLALAVGLSLGTYDYLIPTAAVSIDVNPSIEMKINSRERIVKCEANNKDADIILDGMDLRGTDIDVGVNALIGSMLKNGYLSELKNSVLITVTDPALQERLTTEISDLLTASLGSAAIMSQTLPAKSADSSLAEQYEISQGKAALINEIIAADSTLSFDELAKLPLNDLNLLASTRQPEQSKITTVGSASSKAYIGTDAAKAAAHKLFPGARFDEIELDFCNGVMAYEVELIYEGFEYELEINAVTGEVIKNEKSGKADGIIDDDRLEEEFGGDSDDKREQLEELAEDEELSSAFSGVKLTAEQALDLVLAQQSLTRDDIRKLKIEPDTERRKPVYKIEFKHGSSEYEFEVDANTGEIKKD